MLTVSLVHTPDAAAHTDVVTRHTHFALHVSFNPYSN